ncbi:XRE family transcriptional regulator [Streptomyces syringium]|uniref:Tetratricopeptide (TPR) repeat protein n=1 Tax=Streptomyces syringium TaxID=76729 RepID=A0ABS4XWA2_9ACTN|nr:XRE family transcriptional regulator [Streptomyces syringium]MBP2400793.1 tetratricopeptide (TPR) repeat protein [Streptomyces syringium]
MNTPATPHKPTCARQIRVRGEAAGQPPQQIAPLIHEHCGVSKLRAQRLARGKTLVQAGTELRDLAQQGVQGPRVEGDQLGSWETDTRTPRLATVDLLCRYDECTAFELGLSASQPPGIIKPTAAPHLPAVLSPAAGHQTPASPGGHLTAPRDPLTEQIEAARRCLDRTLAMTSVSTGQLDLLDERILWLRRAYLYTPPAPMLHMLLRQLDEIRELAAERQPASVQVRLSEMTALLATLVADALMKLGHLASSRAWYDTAQNAADDSGHPDLRARVRAQRAMLPYYYGPLADAVALAREARLLARGRPTATGAFAAAEARALARQGDNAGAETAIHYARQMFEQSEAGPEDDAFAFPARRLLLYLSGAYTALGRSTQARQVQDEALPLYPARTGIDPALLRLEAAICLANDHSPTEACQLAVATYLQVPSAHRTPILEERARHVIAVLPPAIRNGRAAKELTEVLALPAGPR